MLTFAHRDHSSAKGGHSLDADDLREVFLYLSGNLQLPCGRGFFHIYFTLMMK